MIEVLRLRNRYLTASEAETQLHLLDTEVEMVRQVAELVRRKGRRVKASVICLAIASDHRGVPATLPPRLDAARSEFGS